jgi:hypothetical protein
MTFRQRASSCGAAVGALTSRSRQRKTVFMTVAGVTWTIAKWSRRAAEKWL